MTGTYSDWSAIRYVPVKTAHYPRALVHELPAAATVLEIGCHDGIVSRYIARRRRDVSVHGIDINVDAIAAGRKRAAGSRLRNVHFDVADATSLTSARRYDAIVTIRVLTCFADSNEWRGLVTAVRSALRPSGHWYVVDYIFDESNPAYAPRYAAGAAAGWRRGNFRVDGADGNPLFIAHHHTQEEIKCLTQTLTVTRLRRFRSSSMHGNPASMFELLGRHESVRA